MNFDKRIEGVKKFLKKNSLDAFLISQPENRRYLSGYTGSEHSISESSGLMLIPAKGKPYLLTDFRYKIQAETEVTCAEVKIYKKGLLALLKTLLPDLGVKKLGFESSYTLHSTAKKLTDLGKKVGFKLSPLTDVIEKMRIVKDEDEIDLLRKSVLLNEQIFQDVYKKISTNMSEIDLALMIETSMRQRGAEAPSFDSIIASGLNSALPHAVPTISKIVKNEPLTIDMGCILNGYCSDMTRTFAFGKASKKYKKIHRLVRKAQLAGMAAIADGVRASDVDKAARNVIKEAGYGKYFGHALGHGVGLAIHEDPRLSTMNRKKLKEGMVITVEPGIYIPGWGGIRLENMVVVRKNGFENFNKDTTQLDI